MSDPSKWQFNWLFAMLTTTIQILLCSHLAAETISMVPSDDRGSLPELRQIVALAPSASTATSSSINDIKASLLRKKLVEARAILEDLRSFADTAQKTIRMSEEIKTLHQKNKRLKKAIIDHTRGRQNLAHGLIKAEAEIDSLTRAIVANWLMSLRVERQFTADDSRLTSARMTWIETENRLILLKHGLAQHRDNTRNLRVKSAALAAEIGRTKRQIINLQRETSLSNDDRQSIETMTRQLRHDVSSQLRTLLTIN